MVNICQINIYMHIYLYRERVLVGQFVWLSALSFVQEVSWSIVQDGLILLCVLFDIPTILVLYIVSTSLQWAPLEMWKSEQVYIGYHSKSKSVMGQFVKLVGFCCVLYSMFLLDLYCILYEQIYSGFHWKCGKVNKFTLGII